jgi:hypothetical protein
MVAMEVMQISVNALTGTVPLTWGSWSRVNEVALFANPQLTGCLPPAWRGKVNSGKSVLSGPYKGGDPLTAGTNISGCC